MSQSEEKHFPTVTKTWSDNIESVIKQIGESCKSYKWMNIFVAYSSSFKYNGLMYLLICIGPLAGILESIETITDTDSPYLKIIIIILSFLTGIISSIIKYSKFEQKTITHKNMAAKYASLETNIRRQLSLSREDRVNAGQYLEWVSTSYDDMFSSMPLITDSAYKRWTEFAKQKNLVVLEKLSETVEDKKDDIKKLTSTHEITINKDKGHKRSRTEVYNSVPELNQYCDKRMQYELNRLYGM